MDSESEIVPQAQTLKHEIIGHEANIPTEYIGVCVTSQEDAIRLAKAFWTNVGRSKALEQAQKILDRPSGPFQFTDGDLRTDVVVNYGDNDKEFPYIFSVQGNNQEVPEDGLNWLAKEGFIQQN